MSAPPLPPAMLRRAIGRLTAQRGSDAIKAESARCLDDFKGWMKQHAPELDEAEIAAHAQGMVIAVLHSAIAQTR